MTLCDTLDREVLGRVLKNLRREGEVMKKNSLTLIIDNKSYSLSENFIVSLHLLPATLSSTLFAFAISCKCSARTP